MAGGREISPAFLLITIMDFIRIGEIVSAHGIKGGLKVWIYNTEDPIIYKIQKVYIGDGRVNRETTISRVRKIDNRFCILKVMELASRREAEEVKKRYLLITPDMLPPLPDNYVYISLLIGSSVFDENYTELGIVEDFIHNGAHSIMIVRHLSGSEFMVPFVEEFIKFVDREKGQIIIHMMEGLIE